MSHFPPGGPPHGPWRPPHTPGMAFVPTPVMMPMPGHPPRPSHGHPTYITNVYQPTPFLPPQSEPVQVVHHPPVVVSDQVPLIDWAPATPHSVDSLTSRAYVAGVEAWDKSPIWAIRSHHNGECVPGKLAVKSKAAYIPYNGKELLVHNFEVLCAPAHALRWLPARDGQVPAGAFPAGNTQNGEPLYICRVNHKNSVTPGKVHPSHRCAYISFGNQELPFKEYEVLCKLPNQNVAPTYR